MDLALQIVSAVREVKASYNVSLKTRVNASILCMDSGIKKTMEEYTPVMETLAFVNKMDFVSSKEEINGLSAKVQVSNNISVLVEIVDHVDVDSVRKRNEGKKLKASKSKEKASTKLKTAIESDEKEKLEATINQANRVLEELKQQSELLDAFAKSGRVIQAAKE